MLPLVALLAALLATAAGPLLAHFRLISPMAGFLIFIAAAPLGILAAAAGVWTWYFRGAWMGAWVALAGLLPVLMIVVAAIPAFRHPRINDVTTDPEDPPQFLTAPDLPDNRHRDFSFPASSVTIIAEHYPDLRPVRLDDEPEAVYRKALNVAASMPHWEITRRDPGAGTIESVATSPLFGFKDDVIIRVRRYDGSSIVDLRSKSRDGKSDLGANAARIRAYVRRLTAES